MPTFKSNTNPKKKKSYIHNIFIINSCDKLQLIALF